MSPSPTTAPWIIIPTYNERGSIEELLTQICALPLPHAQILIVDDNSPDGTAAEVDETARQLDATDRIHTLKTDRRLGFARSYCLGFTHAAQAGATAIVHLDADLSHDPAMIPIMLTALEKSDIVIGSRYSQGISIINWSLYRLFLSLAANWYVRLITSLPYADATSGFRAWRTDALLATQPDTLKINGYGFLIGMLYRAHRTRHTVTEIPIVFTERRAGRSKMSKRIMVESLLRVPQLAPHASPNQTPPLTNPAHKKTAALALKIRGSSS